MSLRRFEHPQPSTICLVALALVLVVSIGICPEVRAQWVTRTALFGGGGSSSTVLPETARNLWGTGPVVEAGLGVGLTNTIFFRPSVTFARTRLDHGATREVADLGNGEIAGGSRRAYSVMGDVLLAPGVGSVPTRLAPYLLLGAGVYGSGVDRPTYGSDRRPIEAVPGGTSGAFAVRTGAGVGFAVGGPIGLFIEANAELAFASERSLRIPVTGGLVYISR